MYIYAQRLSSLLGDPNQFAQPDAVIYLRAGGEIRKQLERNFRADDVTGYLDRRAKLRRAFESVPKSFAKHLLDQLLDKNDPLTKLFNYKISRHTRQEMISILLNKMGTAT